MTVWQMVWLRQNWWVAYAATDSEKETSEGVLDGKNDKLCIDASIAASSDHGWCSQ
jgi:hypothetical protein